jgi:UDP-glucose 4-epimerase
VPRHARAKANSVRIGVTGGSGFLGSILTKHLAASGHEVLALTRTLPPSGEGAHPGVAWVQGDLASSHDAAAFTAGADTIIHLAWTNTPLTSNAHLTSDVTANILPTLTLLEAVRDAATRPHIVFASSGGTVYGAPREKRPFREDDDCRPQSSHGIQKLTIEQYLRMSSEHGWLTATALRIGNPYGVPLPPERLQGFIGTAVSQLRSGTPIRVFGNPANVRDYLHVTDMCRAFEQALEPQGMFDVFNIGSGTAHSVENILELIEELDGAPVAVYWESSAAADELASWVVLDVGKAREKLRWSPEITLRDGLSRLLSASAPE